MIKSPRYYFNLYRRRFYWDKNKCIFIHVPKAAGTSVSKALYGRTLGHYSALELQETFPRFFKETFTFSLVRNPWDRALSAYQFAKRGRTEDMGIHKPQQYQTSRFESFERFVIEWLPAQDLTSVDFIFRPQWHFVCDESGEVIVDYLGKVENLQDDLLKIGALIDRQLNIGKSNSTRQPGVSYQSAFKTNEMIDTVNQLYRKDVEKFGYQFE